MDIEFYKKAYQDLFNLSNIELIKHWKLHGIKENRLPNYKYFSNTYIDFNLEEYKKNTNFNFINDEQYYAHYHNNNINKLNDNIINKLDDNIINKLLNIKYLQKQDTNYLKINSFIPIYYKNINNLIFTNDNQLKNHFIKHGIKEKREYIYKNINPYYINDKVKWNNVYQYSINKELKYNIDNYQITNTNNIFKTDIIINFYKKYCLECLKNDYLLDYKINNNIIPLIYYCENVFGDNFLLKYDNNENIKKNYDYTHFTLKVILDELKNNNIEWKYFVYSTNTFEINKVIMIHNLFTIYQIEPTINNYFMITNLNNNTDIYITTHQKLFIENIYQKNVFKIDYPITNIINNKTYVLTINDTRYDNFIKNALLKQIDMTFIKFNGINKKDLNINVNINHGHLACSLGHYLILKENENSLENILIMEDDNDFNDNFNTRWYKIKNYLDNNLDEWEIFVGNMSLTIYPYELKIVNGEKLIKYTNSTKTNFIYYNQKIIPKIIKYYNDIYFNLFKILNNNDWIIDRFIRVFNCITCIPFITNEIPNLISQIDNIKQKYYLDYNIIEKDIYKIINKLI